MSLSREKEIQTLLQRALKFTGDDLQTNRVGVLTEAQKDALRQERFWTIIGYIAIGILIGLVLSRSLLAAIFMPLITLIVLAGSAWSYYRLKRAIDQGEVESVTGIVRRSIEFDRIYRRRRSRVKPKYQILIADEIFNVEKSVHDAFIDRSYAVGSTEIKSRL